MKRCGTASLALALLFLSLQPAWATKIGAVGDSLTDEYFESSYGGAGAYAQGWMQQLVQYRGLDAGPTAAAAGQPGGTWNAPRRTGYEYNWARFGADTGSAISTGQHTGLANQIAPKGIDYAVIEIGSNDFDNTHIVSPFTQNAYQNIYNQTWSAAQINSFVANSVANITTMLDTVRATGVKTVLVGIVDPGMSMAAAGFTDASRRQLVTAVIDQANAQLKAIAQTDHLVFVDLNAANVSLVGTNFVANPSIVIGGVTINLTGASHIDTGSNPTGGYIADDHHFTTPIQGMVANLMMTALNIGYHANLSLFSETELLAHRGIAYGGSDTLAANYPAYSSFVTNYVPEPSAWVLMAGGLALLGARILRARYYSPGGTPLVG
jgi:lysophospholipase L1-like esterase